MLRALIWSLAFVGLWFLAGGLVVATAGPFRPSGEFVDIGGRKLRLVCKGDGGGLPTVWMEAGAFGLAADFAAIQDKLAAKGVRSCAYDRAGMGWSDPGPRPRTSAAIVGDLEKLMAASGEPGPFVMMGHSMAGIHLRLFAARNPDKVAGLVLIEAATPGMINANTAKFLNGFTMISRVAAVSGTVGFTNFLYYMGDRIGLPPQGQAEKRHAYVKGRHARTAANEVVNWRLSGEQAAATPPYDPRLPVAVILAGNRSEEWTISRREPERASQAGWFRLDPTASHNSILGMEHGDLVVEGVSHVMGHLRPPPPTPQAAPQPEAGPSPAPPTSPVG